MYCRWQTFFPGRKSENSRYSLEQKAKLSWCFGSIAIYMNSIRDAWCAGAWSWICINARIIRMKEWKKERTNLRYIVRSSCAKRYWGKHLEFVVQHYNYSISSNTFDLLYHRRFPFISSLFFSPFIASFHSFIGFVWPNVLAIGIAICR